MIFIILVFCEGSGGFRVGSGWFRVVPGRFRLVPAGSGRFRVGSAFYIHPSCSGSFSRAIVVCKVLRTQRLERREKMLKFRVVSILDLSIIILRLPVLASQVTMTTKRIICYMFIQTTEEI